jgi:Rps23 Pro-64 3,4-dihydroxylase Tpa1-like proline 4-hydroxylase
MILDKYKEILSKKSENLEKFGNSLKNQYSLGKPYPHIAIDNFFSEDFLNEVLNDFPDLSKIKYSENYKNQNEIKFANNDYNNFPEKIKYFFNFLNSNYFLNFLQNLTSIKEKLVADKELKGGGLHEIKSGGLLKIHTDFNKHPSNGLDRRINVLIYLNKNWKEEYKGSLELWDKDMKFCETKISPIFNRMVVFSTTDFSNHGHPEPMLCPKEYSRKSIALYYFSKGRPANEITDENFKNRTKFKNRSGFSNEVKNKSEYIKNFFRKFSWYQKMKNFEKKFLRKKK